jgi:hypothetical protein
MGGEDTKLTETWPQKLAKALVEHALKIMLGGLLAILGAFMGARYNGWICKLAIWFGDGWC